MIEKTLTAAELKKREEIAKAMERDNPGMDMSKKMAIATATAKRVIAAEACWTGYKQVGMKKKGNRQVPNCVPEKKVEEEVPGNAIGQGGVDMAPNMARRLKTINVTDRRRRKDKQPVMLKRFRHFAEEN